MNSFVGSVSLIELGSIRLAVTLEETLTIGQGSEIKLSQNSDNSIGTYDYAGTDLPAYYLNDKLLPSAESLDLNENQFCIGLRTDEEENYFLLLCKQYEQIEISEQTHEINEVPSFMCNERMLVTGAFMHQQNVYLITTPDKLIEYIASNNADQNQEVING